MQKSEVKLTAVPLRGETALTAVRGGAPQAGLWAGGAVPAAPPIVLAREPGTARFEGRRSHFLTTLGSRGFSP